VTEQVYVDNLDLSEIRLELRRLNDTLQKIAGLLDRMTAAISWLAPAVAGIAKKTGEAKPRKEV